VIRSAISSQPAIAQRHSLSVRNLSPYSSGHCQLLAAGGVFFFLCQGLYIGNAVNLSRHEVTLPESWRRFSHSSRNSNHPSSRLHRTPSGLVWSDQSCLLTHYLVFSCVPDNLITYEVYRLHDVYAALCCYEIRARTTSLVLVAGGVSGVAFPNHGGVYGGKPPRASSMTLHPTRIGLARSIRDAAGSCKEPFLSVASHRFKHQTDRGGRRDRASSRPLGVEYPPPFSPPYSLQPAASPYSLCAWRAVLLSSRAKTVSLTHTPKQCICAPLSLEPWRRT
jgi:hypothetical protein